MISNENYEMKTTEGKEAMRKIETEYKEKMKLLLEIKKIVDKKIAEANRELPTSKTSSQLENGNFSTSTRDSITALIFIIISRISSSIHWKGALLLRINKSV